MTAKTLDTGLRQLEAALTALEAAVQMRLAAPATAGAIDEGLVETLAQENTKLKSENQKLKHRHQQINERLDHLIASLEGQGGAES